MNTAKIEEIIVTTSTKGLGKSNDDPVRIVKEYWTMEGALIFRDDKFKDSQKVSVLAPKIGLAADLMFSQALKLMLEFTNGTGIYHSSRGDVDIQDWFQYLTSK